MARFEEAALLLDRAHEDLLALRNMLDMKEFSDSVFGFHAQQAVEKAAKAWLIIRDIDVGRTHDLRLLLLKLGGAGLIVSVDWQDLADLNDFAVQYRYGAPPDDAPLSRLGLLGRGERFVHDAESAIHVDVSKP